jgi:hypothetical protein
LIWPRVSLAFLALGIAAGVWLYVLDIQAIAAADRAAQPPASQRAGDQHKTTAAHAADVVEVRHDLLVHSPEYGLHPVHVEVEGTGIAPFEDIIDPIEEGIQQLTQLLGFFVTSSRIILKYG